MGKISEKDMKLLAIWALHRMGISYRNISRLLGHSRITINRYFKKACEKINSGNWDILPYIVREHCKDKMVYIGSSRDVERLYAKLYQRPTGGGWQASKRRKPNRS